MPSSDCNGTCCCWAFKSCFVSLRNRTFLLDLFFFHRRWLLSYLVQFLEGLSICPKRGRKDLNNLLWHGVKSCKEAEFHTSHIRETYGSRFSSESLSIVTAFRHLWWLNSIYINITFSSVWNTNRRWCSFQVPCHSWGNCPFVSLCLTFLMYLSNSFPSQFESNVWMPELSLRSELHTFVISRRKPILCLSFLSECQHGNPLACSALSPSVCYCLSYLYVLVTFGILIPARSFIQCPQNEDSICLSSLDFDFLGTFK